MGEDRMGGEGMGGVVEVLSLDDGKERRWK